MPARNGIRSKRAISPILATLLLIVIAVAAIVVTYAWIMTYTSNLSNQGGVILYKENTFWNSTERKTYITIGNSGTGNTKIVRLYLGTVQNNPTDVTSSTNIGNGISLNSKSAATLSLSWPNEAASSWTTGNSYYFKVVTETGHELAFPEQAP